jgi:hypothetical protein
MEAVNADLPTKRETPDHPGQSISANIGLDLVEQLSPEPTDKEFRHLGLTDRQIRLLADQPNHIRQEVYSEALRLLMERDTGNDSLSDFFAT